MEQSLVLNLDKVRQGIAVDEGELLHKPQMDMLLDKIRQIMQSVADFRQQFNFDQRPSSVFHRRHHDAILLSGARGTGKTTFLLSALHTLQRQSQDGNYSFCVFEPIDPTLFGYNEHILFTLISMIAKEVCRCRDFCETSRYCQPGGSGDWEAWEKQLKDLAKGLQTVGDQREDISSGPASPKNIWEDAEYLLEEGIDKARSSYELEYKLHSFINTSLKLLHKDAFVLGLDDVDTRPGIGWHVLEVLRRYLTTPQIIVIVSGNMELFQKLVERQQLKNFGLDFSSSNDALQKFSPQVTELTNQYLLKVLRTPLRIELLPFYEALERTFQTSKNPKEDSNISIDDYCIIKIYDKRVPLSAILNVFYNALSCSNQNLQVVFRKALLDNSARTVLQIAEQLIEQQSSSQSRDNMFLIRRVADILRVAFFDYLIDSDIEQPQEYFERLRDGVGIEKITRLLFEGKLPEDASLRPIHGDLRENNSLLALTSGLTAAAAANSSIFFLYFFKVCFALQVLEGQQKEEIKALLGETSLTTLAFRCSSQLYGYASRPGWRAPGILGLYGTSIKKNIPDHVKRIYGDDIIELLKEIPPDQLLRGHKELMPFMHEMCRGNALRQQRGNVLLRGYFIATYDSLQNDIKSWHQALVPHGFYKVINQGSTYVFFSFWGLLGLMSEILTCATKEHIFNIFSRNARAVRLATLDDAGTPPLGKISDNASVDDADEADIAGESDSASGDGADKQLVGFIQWLLAWKKDYADKTSLCFLPPVLCERVFKRFLNAMERLNNINSSDIFLGSYIHKSIVILFNALLVEEYLAYHGKADGLNLKTPLASDDIFIQNLHTVFEAEKLGRDSDPTRLPPDRYPLTRLVMACPLWRFYVKPDDKAPESISGMLQRFWPEHFDQMGQVTYIDEQHHFDNLYYIYNALAIRRRIVMDGDLRTPLGMQVDIPQNPQKIMSKTLVDALEQAIQEGLLTKDKLAEMDDGTEDFAKSALNLLYISVPSIETLWSKAAAKTRRTILNDLREILGNDTAGNA